jgi:hypothetical protein
MPEASICDIRLYPAVLIADQSVEVLPFGIIGIGWRLERIVRDMTGAARHADAERRFDRSIEKPVGAGIAAAGIARQGLAIALPGCEGSVELSPFLGIEAWVGEFAEAKRAGRCAELQIARALPLVDAAMGSRRVERRVFEVASRIAISLLADELQKLGIAPAPLKSVCLLKRLRWAIGIAGNAAIGIWDGAPALEEIAFILRRENPIPINGDAKPL